METTQAIVLSIMSLSASIHLFAYPDMEILWFAKEDISFGRVNK